MRAVDHKKELKHLYRASTKKVVEVTVPPMTYLMLDGVGDPNTAPAYKHAVEALFSVSYTAKFAVKKGPLAVDYKVMPLEGLWWTDDMSTFSVANKSSWKWTMMMMQPDLVTRAVLEDAIAAVGKKKPELVAVEKLRMESFDEGRCAQVLHVGPFSDEGPTVARVHAYIAEHGALCGKHHEIYLSDVRRADPSRWRTIIRQPME